MIRDWLTNSSANGVHPLYTKLSHGNGGQDGEHTMTGPPPLDAAGSPMTAEPLPYLETFVRAAELSSFTAAARSLALTQGAVSQRVQALEAAVGVALFHRRAGRVLLTDAGHRLHDYARRILDLHAEARVAVGGPSAAVAAELILAASSVPGEYLLPGLLSDFQGRHPHVQVRATVGDTAQVMQLLEKGRADLGLVGDRSNSPHLEFRPFLGDELVLVIPADDPWRRRRRVTTALLAGRPLVLREAGSGSRACLERALSAACLALRDFRVALELGSNEAIKEAVQRGLGVAVLSAQTVRREVRAGQLHALRVDGLTLGRDLFAAWDRRRVLSSPAHLFLDLLPARLGRPTTH